MLTATTSNVFTASNTSTHTSFSRVSEQIKLLAKPKENFNAIITQDARQLSKTSSQMSADRSIAHEPLSLGTKPSSTSGSSLLHKKSWNEVKQKQQKNRNSETLLSTNHDHAALLRTYLLLSVENKSRKKYKSQSNPLCQHIATKKSCILPAPETRTRKNSDARSQPYQRPMGKARKAKTLSQRSEFMEIDDSSFQENMDVSDDFLHYCEDMDIDDKTVYMETDDIVESENLMDTSAAI